MFILIDIEIILLEHVNPLNDDKWRPVQPNESQLQYFPDSKVHRANMGPTWVLSAPDGPRVGPMNFAIRVNNSSLRPQHSLVGLPWKNAKVWRNPLKYYKWVIGS